ncbi:unnamed protein product [Oppiella nova]|uniref:E2 ubiquitin-conjugating enzyme n=1 Tax=Oppiella nova TaxID=334625 RepID=A0A7R9QGY0_9ACAR|nr:unnamed protein product [Oppiella nova]CAG2165557.1 unnamed protein product [Oppiella nova]
MASQSTLILRKQLNDLKKNPVDGFSAGLVDENNLYKWEVMIVGPPDTLYEGGMFRAVLDFPDDFPQKPPRMRFTGDIWHPNIHLTGEVCISILHQPGEDTFGYEKASERWTPVHTVETILLSVISLLSDPNDDSPANVDAAKQFRHDYQAFKKRVSLCVKKSQEMA